MNEIQNLAEKVRTEATVLFYGGAMEDSCASWGDEICSAKCDPSINFTTFSLGYWKIPKDMRPLVSDISHLADYNRYEDRIFFHYVLNKSKIAKDSNKHLVPAIGKLFDENFGEASCIYTNFGGETEFVGKINLMQAVMDCLKSGPNEAQQFLVNLIGRNNIETTKKTHIYDLVKEPKEVHY